MKRLWISSLEDSTNQNGFEHLFPGSNYENLADAAVCRAQADWLIGMNAIRAFTTKYFKRLTVGRVQTPTLSMLVDRGNEIANFKKVKYYNVAIDLQGMKLEKQKIYDEAEAEETAENVIHVVQGKYGLDNPFADFPRPVIRQVMNNKKVFDHHAIIPAMELEKTDVNSLRNEESKVLFLVSLRLLEATGEFVKAYCVYFGCSADYLFGVSTPDTNVQLGRCGRGVGICKCSICWINI